MLVTRLLYFQNPKKKMTRYPHVWDGGKLRIVDQMGLENQILIKNVMFQYTMIGLDIANALMGKSVWWKIAITSFQTKHVMTFVLNGMVKRF